MTEGEYTEATLGEDGEYHLPDGTTIKADDVSSYPVPLEERQGVFAHCFKCPACKVEFILLSWRRERPAEVAVGCPECHSGVRLMGSVTLNERPTFALTMHPSGDGAVEIYTVPRILAKAAEATG